MALSGIWQASQRHEFTPAIAYRLYMHLDMIKMEKKKLTVVNFVFSQFSVIIKNH